MPASEENMMILRMLQDGTITAEQAAELLHAMDAAGSNTPRPPADVSPAAPQPPAAAAAEPMRGFGPPEPQMGIVPPPGIAPPGFPPNTGDFIAPASPPQGMDGGDNETLTRARAKIAAARERVAGVQEQLSAADEKLNKADGNPNPWEQVADALKDVPGARSIGDALRGIDTNRIAAAARRQARRVGKSIRSSLEDLNIDVNLNLANQFQGEPTLSAPREVAVTVASGSSLRIKNSLGGIEAVGAPDIPEVRAAGTLQIWDSGLEAAQAIASDIRLIAEAGDDGNATIRVEGQAKSARRMNLDLKVFVPNGVRVSLISPSGDLIATNLGAGVVLATQSGDARAVDIEGNVGIETASGDITIENITGSAQATNASGDIEIINAREAVKATTQSGDVSIRDTTVKSLAVESVSGDLRVHHCSVSTLRTRSVSGDVELAEIYARENSALDADLDTVSGTLSLEIRGDLAGGAIRLGAVSGDLELSLPYQTNASLTISTKSGEIDGKLRGKEDDSRNLRASGMNTMLENVGGGAAGARLTLSTLSGDINVRQSLSPEENDGTNGDGSAHVPPPPVVPDSPSEVAPATGTGEMARMDDESER